MYIITRCQSCRETASHKYSDNYIQQIDLRGKLEAYIFVGTVCTICKITCSSLRLFRGQFTWVDRCIGELLVSRTVPDYSKEVINRLNELCLRMPFSVLESREPGYLIEATAVLYDDDNDRMNVCLNCSDTSRCKTRSNYKGMWICAWLDDKGIIPDSVELQPEDFIGGL